MKTKTIIGIVACFACFCAAFFAGYEVCMSKNDVAFLKEANAFKYDLIELEEQALDLADYLMDKHDLWDKDGSDEMEDYLEVRHQIDSLIATQL